MQTDADMRGVGVKNRRKIADVLYGRPLMLIMISYCEISEFLYFTTSLAHGSKK